MAIHKFSKNTKIFVENKYMVISSKLSKTAEVIKIDATKDNLILNCIKKITANGEIG